MTIDGDSVNQEDRISVSIVIYRNRHHPGEYLVEHAEYNGPEDDLSGDDRKAICDMLDPIFDGFRKWRRKQT